MTNRPPDLAGFYVSALNGLQVSSGGRGLIELYLYLDVDTFTVAVRSKDAALVQLTTDAILASKTK